MCVFLVALALAVYRVAAEMMFAGAARTHARTPRLLSKHLPRDRLHTDNVERHRVLEVHHRGRFRSDATLHTYLRAPAERGNAKRPVVLVMYLHGNAGTIDSYWQDVCDRLYNHLQHQPSRWRWAVGTFDYRRFGRSSSVRFPTPTLTVQDAHAVLLKHMHACGAESFVLYGRSLGGAVATHLAACTDHRAAGIFLETPFLGTHNVHVPASTMAPNLFACAQQLRSLSDLGVPVHSAHAFNDKVVDTERNCELLQRTGHDEIRVFAGKHTHNSLFMSPEWQQALAVWLRSCGKYLSMLAVQAAPQPL